LHTVPRYVRWGQMTTVRSAPPVVAPAVADGAPGARLRRLERRRRLLREELLAVAVLIIALAITLVVLGLQWLDSGPSAVSSAAGLSAYIHGGPT
jgi:hypothetical protein